VTATMRASAGKVRSSSTGLSSAVYEGTVHHRRFGPDVTHEFSYPVAMPLLYLDEVAPVAAMHPLLSARRPAPVWFRRDDFIGEPAIPLRTAVLDRVEEQRGERPAGRVAMLANLRTWGFLFNPISLYYCTGADGEAVEAVVAEVENTPWHERCSYVIGAPGRHRFGKAMHVSPFLPMEVDYEIRYSAPGEVLIVRIDVLCGDERLLSATLLLRRRGLDRRALGRLLWARPAPTHAISAAIYTEAARLRLRRAKFHAHPARRDTAAREEPACPAAAARSSRPATG
jgi:DUF1365 family protein